MTASSETAAAPVEGRGLSVIETIVGDRRFAFVGSLLVLMIIWQAAAAALNVSAISSPLKVGAQIYALFTAGELIPNLARTLRRTVWAMVATTFVGTTVGILAGWNEFWRGMFQDYILAGLALPSLLAAIFAAIWFGGTSDVTPAVAGSLLAFPFLAQNVQKAVENIDGDLIDMSKSFDITRERVLRRVVLWSVLPEWFSGMRNAFTVAWKIVTLAEFVGGSNGVGFQIGEALGILSMEGVLAWTFSFSFVIIAVEFGIFEVIERRLFAWRKEASMSLGP